MFKHPWRLQTEKGIDTWGRVGIKGRCRPGGCPQGQPQGLRGRQVKLVCSAPLSPQPHHGRLPRTLKSVLNWAKINQNYFFPMLWVWAPTYKNNSSMEMFKESLTELVGNLGESRLWHFLPKSYHHCKDQAFPEGLNSRETHGSRWGRNGSSALTMFSLCRPTNLRWESKHN